MKQKLISAILSVAVVAMLLIASPAQAVQLSAKLPKNASAGAQVQFTLQTEIAAGENIPLEDVIVTIAGPSGSQTCIFAPNGTTESGCEGISITLAKDTTEQLTSERYGSGWNGTAKQNTSFGYGYGFGAQEDDAKLAWDLTWDTTGKQAGEYTVSYAVSAASESQTRQYVLKKSKKITLAGSALPAGANASLYVKAPFPINDNYVLVCENNIENARYDWHYGDGSKLIDIHNQNTFHRFGPGTYNVTCVAHNSTTSASASMQIVNGAQQSANLYVKQPFPKENDFVFVCDNTLSGATRYDWTYGDGSQLLDVANKDTFHRFAQEGNFTVSCTAKSESGTATSSIDVSVSDVKKQKD